MEQVSYILFRFKTVFASLFLFIGVLLLAAIITATGNGTVFDSRTQLSKKPVVATTYDTPNYVTKAGYNLVEGTKRLTISSGTAIYRTSRAITNASSTAATTVVETSVSSAQAVADGAVLAATTVGSGVLGVAKSTANATTAITNNDVVSAYIQPAKTATTPIPVIDAQTSLALLDQLNTEQRAQTAKLLNEQVAENRRLVGTVVAGDSKHGGYPAKWDNARQDSLVDSWGMYNRECVSYAAWKVHQAYGTMPYWGGIGNANQWVRNAKRTGIPTSTAPKVGSVAISMAGYYGHAMWVEAVEGNMIYISQYNYDLNGRYSEMWVDGRNFTYIYFQ
ncbi:MAG: CHAP domain-containing protein [Candidatus Saccharimonadales bacterium]